MRRMLAAMQIVGLLTLGGTAQAQEQDPVPPEQGTVEPARQYFVDISVSEVVGNDRGQVGIGSPTEVVLHATNTSAEAANGVTLKISPTEGVTISPMSLSFGDLAADGGTADRRVTVTIASEDGCQDYTGWEGALSSSLGEQGVKFGVSVLCPGPRLAQELVEFVGGDGDAIAEPGETLQVFISYRNNGRDAATDVRATLSTRSDGVTVTDATSAWGTISPDTVVRARDPFVVTIAKDAKTQDTGCSWDGGSVVVDGGDAPVADQPADQPTSSDGSTPSSSVGSGSSPSGGSGSSQGAPGGGADGQTTTEEVPEDSPMTQEAPAPRPGGEPPGEEPEQPDPSVTVEGTMKVTAAEVSFDDMFSNQMMCLMAEGRPSDARGDAAGGAKDTDALAGAAREDSAPGGRGPSIALAAVLLAAVLTQLGWRLQRART